MGTTTSHSPRYCTFFGQRGGRVRRSLPSHEQPGCGRIDQMATWVGNGIITTFFASLKCCSCISITTDDDRIEAKDVPLMFDDRNSRTEGGELERGQRRRVKGMKGCGR
ncbi:hypothetical protein COCNU_06G019690 [Cocos nucifera]|uniref:Uncharacterized protein n=1 Tax=Cocos nucifera TaxID=13894 RepID=A0A8K0IE00_COCNU|nr:hypothetical protein COCNU_06G019690 [Cocos nucifera]